MQLANTTRPQHQTREDCVLFVGNLSPEVEDQTLFQFFSPIGDLGSVSVKKNFYTGVPKGFGFVNFTTPESAARAKLQLNHSVLKGREIRISFKKDFNKLDPEANLFLKNLSEAVTGKIVEAEFSAYGPIFSCAVRYGEDNKPLGYGYCQFEKSADADKAREELDGKDIEGLPISVTKFLPKSQRKNTTWETNLYVKGFPTGWSLQQVEDYISETFGEFGEIVSRCVRFNEKFGSHFAFVSFKESEEASKAVKELCDHECGDSTLYVGFAQKKYKRKRLLQEDFAKTANETNLFIRSLREEVTEAQLRAAFEKYGAVTSIGLKVCTKLPKPLEAKGIKLQYGFVNFEDKEGAKRAFAEGKKDEDVRALLSPEHDLAREFLFFAQPKAVREQYLRMQRKNQASAFVLQQQMMMFQLMMSQNLRNQRKMGKNAGKRGQAMPMQFPNMPMNMNMNMGNMAGMMMPGQGPMGPAAGSMPMGQFPGMNMPPNQLLAMQQAMNPAAQLMGQTPTVETQDIESKDLSWLRNNVTNFEKLSHDEKRKILGNLMYYRVAKAEDIEKELVPKITGMLIDLEVLELSDIIDILDNDQILAERIRDAITIINEADD